MILQNLLGVEKQPIGPLSDILNEHQDIEFKLAGEAAEQAEQLEDILYKFALSIFIIYVLLAVPLIILYELSIIIGKIY